MEEERSLHLFTNCPLVCAIWFNSLWGLRPECWNLSSPDQFIQTLLSLSNEVDPELILFGAVVCDVIWKAKNQAQFEGMSPNVDSLIQKISNSILEHKRFKATLVRSQTSCYSNVWAKPVRPQVKVNVDAACNFGRVAIAAIAKD